MENCSEVIDQFVEYSIKSDVTSIGKIVDKIDMKNKAEDAHSVTGYLIIDKETGKVQPTQYWRILKFLGKEHADISTMPKGNIPGGYVRPI